MTEMRTRLPSVGSYVAESNFSSRHGGESFWGPNYTRLLAVKDKYDPDAFRRPSRRGQNAGAPMASRD